MDRRLILRRTPWRHRLPVILAATLAMVSSGSSSVRAAGEGAQHGAQTIPHAPPTAPAAISIRFFGVSTLIIDDGRTRLVVDGYFTRPGPWRTLFGRLSSDDDAIHEGLGGSGRAPAALLVAHAHHDHVLDMAAIAGRSPSTVVVGTDAVRRLGLAQRLPEAQLIVGRDQSPLGFGDFVVEPRDVPHGPPLPVIGAWLDGEMRRPPTGPAHFLQFRDPDNLSFVIRRGRTTVLVHPSAGARDLTGVGASVVFLGMGRIGAISEDDANRYFEQLLGRDVRLVVPIHWDAFTTEPGRALQPTPWPLDRVGRGMRRLCDFVARGTDMQVALPARGSEVTLSEEGAWRLEGRWSDPCDS